MAQTQQYAFSLSQWHLVPPLTNHSDRIVQDSHLISYYPMVKWALNMKITIRFPPENVNIFFFLIFIYRISLLFSQCIAASSSRNGSRITPAAICIISIPSL